MIEQILFITIAFTLFVYIFYELVVKNDTKYVPILAIQALGILIKFIEVCFGNGTTSVFNIFITYILSLVIPIIVLIIEKLSKDLSETIEIYMARIYLVIGNKKGAKKILVKLVEEHPQNYMGHKLLAQIYEKEGGQRKAVDEYVQAIDINEKDYDSYYKVATLLIDLDKKEEATHMFFELLNKKPNYVEATIILGDLLIEQEDYKEAVNVYTEALKYDATNYDLNYSLGIVYTMLNDFQNAKLYYEKSATLNSLVYNTKYSLAEIALIYKELEEAEQYFMQVIDDEELGPEAYLELAKISLIKGDKEQAIKYANVAIQECPKKIVEKIQKDPVFAIIIAKLSIPFNLDIEDEREHKLTQKEIKAKEHLEQIVEITKKIGYSDIGIKKKNEEYREEQVEIQKEREE